MPLIYPAIPEDVERAFRSGLAELIEIGWVPTGLPLGRPAGRPLEVWVLDLRHLMDETDINKTAKFVQWQYLVGRMRARKGSPHQTHRAFAIDIECPRGKRYPRITGLERGPHVADVFEELKDLQRRHSLRSDEYLLRRLRIPALASVFWLKGSANGEDLVVPYHCVTRKLRLMQIYRIEQFLAIMKPLAMQALKGPAPAK